MGKNGSFVTIQGARKTHRGRLLDIADRILSTEPPGNVHQVLAAILETGLVINAHVVARKPNDLIIRVEDSLKIKSVEITGNKLLPVELILSAISSRQHKILNYQILKTDIESIENIYVANGAVKPIIRVNRWKIGKDYVALRYKVIEKNNSSADEVIERTEARKPKSIKRENTTTVIPLHAAKRNGAGPAASPSERHQRTVRETPSINGTAQSDAEAIKNAETINAIAVSTDAVEEQIKAYSSAWTGNFNAEDQLRTIRAIAPKAISEIENLVYQVESYRFNDDETENCLNVLRSLHEDLGILINIIEAKKQKPILKRIARKNDKVRRLILSGAKIGLVSPALTIGISHMLSAITGVPIDSTMVSTVFATMVAMPVVENQIFEKSRKTTNNAPTHT